jgi:long-chain acyl-CoA synthetase
MMGEGWFRTGDLARIWPAGFVTIVGRKKELILRGGYSVVPGEVEAALLAHVAVAEAAVVGIPDAALGEEIGPSSRSTPAHGRPRKSSWPSAASGSPRSSTRGASPS